MLSLSSALDDRRLVQLVLAPLGKNSLFSEQLATLSAVREVPYYELYKPKFAQNYQSPFKFLSWSDGSLLFEYKRLGQLTDQDGDFCDVQSSKRVLMVMGLINFPEVDPNGWDAIERELDQIADQFKHVVLKRFLVFNFNFDASNPEPPLARCKNMRSDPESVVIFPPDAACEGGSMVEVHYREVICRAAVKLVCSLQAQMEACEDARQRGVLPNHPLLPLGSPHDDKDEIGTSKDSSKSRNKYGYKKRPLGRIRKWMGDLSMQVCSPLDAVENYVQAINESRSLNDPLWLAGALDGYASAVLLLKTMAVYDIEEAIGRDLRTLAPRPVIAAASHEEDHTVVDADRVYVLAEERCSEAMLIYGTSVSLRALEVGCAMRMALMFERAEPFYDQSQKACEYVLRGMAVPGLSPVQQIECAVEGALLMQRMGLLRKCALLLYISALMAADMGNMLAADNLVNKALALYDILPSAASGGQMWKALQVSLFVSAVMFAQESGDASKCAQWAGSCLQLLAQQDEEQRDRAGPAVISRRSLGLEKCGLALSSLVLPSATQRNLAAANCGAVTGANLTEEALRWHSSQGPRALRAVATELPRDGPVMSFKAQSVTGDLDIGASRRRPVAQSLASQRSSAPHAPASLPVSSLLSPPTDPDDFLHAHLSELAGQAEALVKQSFRSLAVPQLSQRFSSIQAAVNRDGRRRAGRPTSSPSSRFEPSAPDRLFRQLLRELDSSPPAAPTLGMSSSLAAALNSPLPPPPPPSSSPMTSSAGVSASVEPSQSLSSAVAGLSTVYTTADTTYVHDLLDAVCAQHYVRPHVDTQQVLFVHLQQVAGALASPMSASLPLRLLSCRPLASDSYMRPLPFKGLVPRFAQWVAGRCRVGMEPGAAAETEGAGEGGADAEPETTKGAFFYDPFEARRKLRREQEQEAAGAKTFWSTGHPHCLVAYVYNPLPLAVPLTAVQAILDSGDEARALPVEALLPPQACARLVIPLALMRPDAGHGSVSPIQLLGLRVFMDKVWQAIALDADGCPANAPPLPLSVQKTLPQPVLGSTAIHRADWHHEVHLYVSWDAAVNARFVPSSRNSGGVMVSHQQGPLTADAPLERVETSLDLLSGELRSERLLVCPQARGVVPAASIAWDHRLLVTETVVVANRGVKTFKHLVSDFCWVPVDDAGARLAGCTAQGWAVTRDSAEQGQGDDLFPYRLELDQAVLQARGVQALELEALVCALPVAVVQALCPAQAGTKPRAAAAAAAPEEVQACLETLFVRKATVLVRLAFPQPLTVTAAAACSSARPAHLHRLRSLLAAHLRGSTQEAGANREALTSSGKWDRDAGSDCVHERAGPRMDLPELEALGPHAFTSALVANALDCEVWLSPSPALLRRLCRDPTASAQALAFTLDAPDLLPGQFVTVPPRSTQQVLFRRARVLPLGADGDERAEALQPVHVYWGFADVQRTACAYSPLTQTMRLRAAAQGEPAEALRMGRLPQGCSRPARELSRLQATVSLAVGAGPAVTVDLALRDQSVLVALMATVRVVVTVQCAPSSSPAASGGAASDVEMCMFAAAEAPSAKGPDVLHNGKTRAVLLRTHGDRYAPHTLDLCCLRPGRYLLVLCLREVGAETWVAPEHALVLVVQ